MEGPLSPLLSNILLDELDKELERRGHRFARYADDLQVFVKSKAAGERVLASLERFLAKRLRLQVNREKNAVDRPWKRQFLGFSVTTNLKPRLRVSANAVQRLSPSTLSELNQKVYKRIDEWRNRPIEGKYRYVYLDGVYLKKSWGGAVRSIAVLIAIGVDSEGFRHVLGVVEGAKEDKEGWLSFLRHLKERGLEGVKLFVSDKCIGLVESIGEVYPTAEWQRCVVHFYRNVFTMVPKTKLREVASMLKAIHAQEDLEEAHKKAEAVVEKLEAMRLKRAAEVVRTGVEETLTYYAFPREHWRRLRTNNPMERIIREVRRRTRVVGAFPDGQSAIMLAAARLRHVAGTKWGQRRYMNMAHLRDQEVEKEGRAMVG